MTDNSKAVSINILGRVYQLIVNTDEEMQNIAKAESLIQEMIGQFKESYSYNDDKDLLAMAVIQFATKSVYLENQAEIISTDIRRKIIDIDKLIDMNAL
mgnify:FL=1